MKSRILCICSTAAVIGGSLLFNGCATSIEDDRLPPGAYVPPAPKQNPPPQPITPPGKVDDVDPAQPQTVITPANEQLPPLPPKRTEKRVKNDKKLIHVVQRGDSFWKLASMYGVTVKEIMDANPGVAPNKIYPGKKIVIPAAGSGKKAVSAKPAAKNKKNDKKPAVKADKKVKKTTVKASAPGERYTVRKGDSFGKIAAKYKIKAADLAAANKLSLEKPLWIGQVLIIPQNAVKTAKTAKTNKKAAAPAAKGKKAAAKPQKAAAKKAQAAPAKAPADASKKNEPQPPAQEKSAASKDSLPPAPVAPPDLSDLNEPAAPQKKAAPAADAKPLPAQTTDTIKEDISLDAYAKRVGFSVESLKQYNPNLPADGMIRAGTVVNLP